MNEIMEKEDKEQFKQNIEELKMRIEFLNRARGTFMSWLIELDELMGEFIYKYYIKPDKEEEFKNLTVKFNRDFFTFYQKFRILKNITKDFKEDKSGLRDIYFKLLEEMIEIRNAMAHGEFIVSRENSKDIIKTSHNGENHVTVDLSYIEDDVKEIRNEGIKLRYFHGSKEKTLIIDTKFMKEWEEKYMYLLSVTNFLTTETFEDPKKWKTFFFGLFDDIFKGMGE